MDDRISLLGKSAVDVSARLSSAAQQVLELEGAVRRNSQSADSAAQHFNERLEDVLSRFTNLQQEAQEAQGVLAEEIGQLEAEIGDLADAISQHQSIGVSRVQQLIQDIETMVGNVDGYADRTNASAVQLRESITSLEQQISSAISAISSSCETFGERISSLRSTVEEAQSECGTAISELSEEAQSQQDELDSKFNDLLATFNGERDEIGTLLGQIKSEIVTERVNVEIDQLQSAIEDTLTDLIDKAIEDLLNLLKELDEKAASSGNETSELRKQIEPVVDELEKLVKPLLDSIADAMGALNHVTIL